MSLSLLTKRPYNTAQTNEIMKPTNFTVSLREQDALAAHKSPQFVTGLLTGFNRLKTLFEKRGQLPVLNLY